MELPETLLQLFVSLALGLTIGLERGWRERGAKEGKRVAGVRTYGLIGLLGGFTGLLASETQFAVIGLGFLALAAVLIAGYVTSSKESGEVGLTGVMASMLTFAFGAAATLGHMTEAAMAAVVTTILLSQKNLLHRWIGALEPGEMQATLKLLAISVVILPVLPNHGYGPWGVFNPFEIWWMVVLISGISFIGYFAMKIAGTGKGAILTGFLAGLVSSTALTLSYARMGANKPKSADILATGILVACGSMFPRMILVSGIVHAKVLEFLLLPALAMTAIVYGGAAFLWRRAASDKTGRDETELKNPLELRAAILFGGLLALVLFAASALDAVYGDAGVMAVAGISGITDVDAITLALSRMSQADLAIRLAVSGIVFAGAVNSAVKAAMAFFIGGRALGARVAVPLVAAAATGLALAL